MLQLYNCDAIGQEGKRIGPLAEATEALVRRQINGEYSLTVTLPLGAAHGAEIQAGNTGILCPVDELGNYQFFVVKRPARGIVSGLRIYAEHQSYYYKDVVVAPFLNGGSNGDAKWTFNQALANCKGTMPTNPDWSFTRTNKRGGGHLLRPKDLRSFLLQDLVGKWGGEMVFDGFDVNWVQAMGQDRGLVIRYGANMLDLEVEDVLTDYETGIYPYWGEAGNSSRPLVEINGKILNYSGITAPMQIIKPVDFGSRFESQPTKAQLLEAAQDYAELHAQATIPQSYKVSRIKRKRDLPLDLGDTVGLWHPDWPTQIQVRVQALTFDALRERVQDIEVGALRQSFAAAVAAAK